MTLHPRFKCQFCGAILPAWLPVPQEPNGAMLLHHLTQQYPAEAGAYLRRMHRTEDIARVAALDETQDKAFLRA
jgi:hypothetical protein